MTKRLPGGRLDGDRKRLGRYIRARRLQLGYSSRSAFADACRLSPRTIGDVELGLATRHPSANTIAKLELTLGWRVGGCAIVAGGNEPVLEPPSVIQGARGGIG